MMKSIPENLLHYQSTPEFTELNIPKGLLKAHATKAGVWGKIVVFEGSLKYRILETEDRPEETFLLTPDQYGVVEPTILHEVEAVGSVRFRVEFNRNPTDV